MPRDSLKMDVASVARVWTEPKSMLELLDARGALTSIDQCETELIRMCQALKDPNAPNVSVEPIVNTGKVAALKAVMDSKWKRVNKSVPDLKAIDFTGTHGEGTMQRQLTDLERLHRYQAIRRGALKEIAEIASEEPEMDEDFLV